MRKVPQIAALYTTHSRTWCCKVWHTLQYSVFTSSWRSFLNSPAPSAPSPHLGIPFLSFHICAFHILQALYRPDGSLPSIASNIHNRLLTDTLIISSVPTTRFVSNRFLVHWVALKVCLPTRKAGGGTSDNEFINLLRSSIDSLSILLK